MKNQSNTTLFEDFFESLLFSVLIFQLKGRSFLADFDTRPIGGLRFLCAGCLRRFFLTVLFFSGLSETGFEESLPGGFEFEQAQTNNRTQPITGKTLLRNIEAFLCIRLKGHKPSRKE
jgi:hypothetical protein